MRRAGTGCIAAIAASIVPAPMTVADERLRCPNGVGVEMSAPVGASIRAFIQLRPLPVPVSAPFDADVVLCQTGKVSGRVRLEATMPAHGHGMNYQTAVVATGEGRYTAKQLLFHMPGLWRIELSVREGQRTIRFTHDVTVQ